jgi:hypothetical protein
MMSAHDIGAAGRMDPDDLRHLGSRPSHRRRPNLLRLRFAFPSGDALVVVGGDAGQHFLAHPVRAEIGDDAADDAGEFRRKLYPEADADWIHGPLLLQEQRQNLQDGIFRRGERNRYGMTWRQHPDNQARQRLQF